MPTPTFGFGGVSVAAPILYITTKIAVVPLNAVDTGGGIFSWQNPESGPIAITGIEIDVETAASGACSLDIGATVVSGTTASDNLLDGMDVHTSTGLYNRDDKAGANGKSKQRLAAGGWVTGSKDSGASAGLAGFVYIHYLVLS